MVRDSGQNGPRWHPRLSKNTYHMIRTSGWYVFQDKPLHGTPCLSAGTYHMAWRGTCLRTNVPSHQRLSKNPYHMRGRGTCLRTNSSPANSVCPQTRTTWARRRCGTGFRTERPQITPSSVPEHVPHDHGERVVRVSGQTAPRNSAFVRRHVPHRGERYVFADKRSHRRRLSQNTYHMAWRGTCLRTNQISSSDTRLTSGQLVGYRLSGGYRMPSRGR